MSRKIFTFLLATGMVCSSVASALIPNPRHAKLYIKRHSVVRCSHGYGIKTPKGMIRVRQLHHDTKGVYFRLKDVVVK